MSIEGSGSTAVPFAARHARYMDFPRVSQHDVVGRQHIFNISGLTNLQNSAYLISAEPNQENGWTRTILSVRTCSRGRKLPSGDVCCSVRRRWRVELNIIPCTSNLMIFKDQHPLHTIWSCHQIQTIGYLNFGQAFSVSIKCPAPEFGAMKNSSQPEHQLHRVVIGGILIIRWTYFSCCSISIFLKT